MKKTAALLLTLCVLFLLGACGAQEDTAPSAPEPSASAPTAVPTDTPTAAVRSEIPEEAVLLLATDNYNGDKAKFYFLTNTLYALLGDPERVKTRQEEILTGSASSTVLYKLRTTDAIDAARLQGEDAFFLTDMNFDGKDDLRLLRGKTEGVRLYACWLWDADAKEYVYSDALSALQNPVFDADAGTVTADDFVNGETVKIVYEWTQNKKLAPVSAAEGNSTPTDRDMVSELASVFADGYTDFVKLADTTVDDSPVKQYMYMSAAETTIIAVAADGSFYIDENATGTYRHIVQYRDAYYIGDSVRPPYSAQELIAYAETLAAYEISATRINRAQKTGSVYTGQRLLHVYEVSIDGGSGSVTFAFDDRCENVHYRNTQKEYLPYETADGSMHN